MITFERNISASDEDQLAARGGIASARFELIQARHKARQRQRVYEDLMDETRISRAIAQADWIHAKQNVAAAKAEVSDAKHLYRNVFGRRPL
jgi:multidrug efflux pump subunit AcrA (membrane-fusion protein)